MQRERRSEATEAEVAGMPFILLAKAPEITPQMSMKECLAILG